MVHMGIIVVGGVLEKNGKYLLVQEAKKEIRGKWNLPAGMLDLNENVFEGAKREIFEESGYDVELTGIAKIRNDMVAGDSFIGIIFSTKILKQHSGNNNKNEIMQTKWFSFDEIVGMRDELRSYKWIVEAIEAVENGKICDLDLIGV